MTFVLMQNTSLPKYRPLSSTPKAAYLPVTSYIFLTSETCLLVNLSTCQLVYLSTKQKKSPATSLSQDPGLKKGGFLLSRIALQYHRRRRA